MNEIVLVEKKAILGFWSRSNREGPGAAAAIMSCSDTPVEISEEQGGILENGVRRCKWQG